MANKSLSESSEKPEAQKQKLPPHQWTVEFLRKEFSNESDRAAVILVASLIDNCLTSLIKSYLVPIAQSNDSLFDNATAPLSTFSAKIDISHRIGLLSAKLCRDIHLIRKIRNSFAHDIYGCTFQNGSVRSRVDELYKSATALNSEDDSECRKRFLYITCGILWHLNSITQEIGSLGSPESEWIYETPKEK